MTSANSYETILNNEIYQQLDNLSAMGMVWRADFIAHAVCSAHADGLQENEHKEFWRHCTYQKVRETVRRCINKRAGDDQPKEDPQQYRLPGYDHLHRYYVVRRDGTDMGVPIADMTDNEIDQKVELYRDMGRGCFDHADEFLRYKRDRISADLFPDKSA